MNCGLLGAYISRQLYLSQSHFPSITSLFQLPAPEVCKHTTGITYEENGIRRRLAIDLLQILWLEGDHANEAVDSHQVCEDHQCVYSVPEESPQRWNEIWKTIESNT